MNKLTFHSDLGIIGFRYSYPEGFRDACARNHFKHAMTESTFSTKLHMISPIKCLYAIYARSMMLQMLYAIVALSRIARTNWCNYEILIDYLMLCP